MGSLLLACLLLQAQPAPLDSGALSMPLIRSIDLDAETLLSDSSLLAADILALTVESNRAAYYKLSERGDLLASGKLLPGANSLRFTRPGISLRSQSIFLTLDLLEEKTATQKFLRIQVTVEGKGEMEPEHKEALSGLFRLEMYHADRLIGFRKKRMDELLKLKTGPVMPLSDPGLSGSAIRNQPAGYSISVLGLGMALAKHLAGKKVEKAKQERAVRLQKRHLVTTISRRETKGEKREIPIVIELRVE